MNKYVVAFLSLHVGELHQEIVEAKDAVSAAKAYLDWEHLEDIHNMEELLEEVSNSDAYISVLEIKDTKRWTNYSNAESAAMPVQ